MTPEQDAALRLLAQHVERELRAGAPASTLVTTLRREQKLGCVMLVIVFRRATGASIHQLKEFGLWWSEEGITNVEAFDEHARKLLATLLDV